jgi:phosphopantetheine adenylyltransferase
VDKRRRGAGLPCSFKEVQRADGVGVEVIKGNRSRAIVRGLRGGVDDDVGFDFGNEVENALPVADVEFVVGKVWDEIGAEKKYLSRKVMHS